MRHEITLRQKFQRNYATYGRRYAEIVNQADTAMAVKTFVIMPMLGDMSGKYTYLCNSALYTQLIFLRQKFPPALIAVILSNRQKPNFSKTISFFQKKLIESFLTNLFGF